MSRLQHRLETRLKLFLRSANGNSASTSDKKTERAKFETNFQIWNSEFWNFGTKNGSKKIGTFGIVPKFQKIRKKVHLRKWPLHAATLHTHARARAHTHTHTHTHTPLLQSICAKICNGKKAHWKSISKISMGFAHFSSLIFKMPKTRRSAGGKGGGLWPRASAVDRAACGIETNFWISPKRKYNQLGPIRKSIGFSHRWMQIAWELWENQLQQQLSESSSQAMWVGPVYSGLHSWCWRILRPEK